MRFNWHRFIRLEGFSAQQRQLLTRALESIAADCDGEGTALLRRAAAANGPVIMRSSTNETAQRVIDGITIIDINFAQLGTLAYADAERSSLLDGLAANGARRVSLNGVLVHELYHAGDTRAGKAALWADAGPALTALLMREGLTDQLPVLQRFFSMYDRHDATYPYLLMTDRFGNRVSSLAAFSTHGYADVASLLQRLDPAAVTQALQQSGILGTDGVPRWEHDAVAYTDRFMQRVYGTAEPVRGEYRAVLVTPEPPAVLPPPGCRPITRAARG